MYKIPELISFPNLEHTFSDITDGNMANMILGKQMDEKEVLKNREILLKNSGFDINQTVYMWVRHGNEVLVADLKLAGKSMRDKNFAVQSDGIITNKKGLNLFLLIGDCVPVVFFDPKKKVLGVLHVSRKNVTGVVQVMIKKLRVEFGVNLNNLSVGIGPAARRDTFIFENLSRLNKLVWEPFIEETIDHKFKIDLVGFCRKQLHIEGVIQENIFDCGIDTISDKRFFSHYRDFKNGVEDNGRFACVVGLR